MVAVLTLLSSPAHKQEPIPMASPDHYVSGFRKVYNRSMRSPVRFNVETIRATNARGPNGQPACQRVRRSQAYKFVERGRRAWRTASTTRHLCLQIFGPDDAGCGNSREESRTVRFLLVALHYSSSTCHLVSLCEQQFAECDTTDSSCNWDNAVATAVKKGIYTEEATRTEKQVARAHCQVVQ